MTVVNIKNFPVLYKKTSTGAIQQWQIYVCVEDTATTIVSKYGQVGGKIQESTEHIIGGKNIGKTNETSIIEQAIFQAESDWKKQLKKGYVKTYEDAVEGNIDDIIEGGIFPMLAHKFSEQAHKIKYPALAQPKLDGHRCIAEKKYNTDSRLWSRTRKSITSMPHIVKALSQVMVSGDILDGELYNHDYHDNFEDLTSFIRSESPLPGGDIVQYHVYDYPHPDMTNLQRHNYLQSLKPLFENTPIKIVETLVVNSEDELMEAFDHFISEGYEGCIVRNSNGLYVNKRSYDLQKVKEFSDDEFKVVGVDVSTRGRMAGKAVFICETKEGIQFNAKMIGNMDNLVKYAENPELAIGRIMTVKYQGITQKNKVPRFPVAMRFRYDI